MVSRMDRDVGRLLTLLEDLGIDENTIVFFTSDNGAANQDGADLSFFSGNGPLRGAKGGLYEGGIRVPLLARWPGKIGQAEVSDVLSGFLDMLPTLAELAGVAAPADIDGVSLVPTPIKRHRGRDADGRGQRQ